MVSCGIEIQSSPSNCGVVGSRGVRAEGLHSIRGVIESRSIDVENLISIGSVAISRSIDGESLVSIGGILNSRGVGGEGLVSIRGVIQYIPSSSSYGYIIDCSVSSYYVELGSRGGSPNTDITSVKIRYTSSWYTHICIRE